MQEDVRCPTQIIQCEKVKGNDARGKNKNDSNVHLEQGKKQNNPC